MFMTSDNIRIRMMLCIVLAAAMVLPIFSLQCGKFLSNGN